jgi:two-component system response regulator DesR
MRILLADDDTGVRSALRLLLEQEEGLSVVDEAVDADDLLERAKATCPDLVLLDWSLPRMAADSLLSALRSACPDLTVVALSGRPEVRRAALAAGVEAFVSKTDPPERVLSVIRDNWRS